VAVPAGGRGLRASLAPARLSVDPGGSASAELRVSGVDGGADSLGFEVLGEAATWSWVVPPAEPVSNGEVVARVVTRPPKASSPVAGTSAPARPRRRHPSPSHRSPICMPPSARS